MALPLLQQLQRDPAELEKCKQDPAYFYNKYCRAEGEKVLTNEDLRKRTQAAMIARNMISQISRSVTDNPLTTQDASTGT